MIVLCCCSSRRPSGYQARLRALMTLFVMTLLCGVSCFCVRGDPSGYQASMDVDGVLSLRYYGIVGGRHALSCRHAVVMSQSCHAPSSGNALRLCILRTHRLFSASCPRGPMLLGRLPAIHYSQVASTRALDPGGVSVILRLVAVDGAVGGWLPIFVVVFPGAADPAVTPTLRAHWQQQHIYIYIYIYIYIFVFY